MVFLRVERAQCVGPAVAPLGDDGGDEAVRRHVERRIGHCFVRCQLANAAVLAVFVLSIHHAQLVAFALLDQDRLAARAGEIQRRARCCDMERHAGFLRCQRPR